MAMLTEKQKKEIIFYKDMIDLISKRSKCLSRQIGSIIVFEGRIIAEGWNGAPKGCEERFCKRCKSEHESGKELENSLCCHSEINAISSAAYLGFSLRGTSIYVTNKPCSDCAKAIVACGIKEVYFFEDYKSDYTDYIFRQNNMKWVFVEMEKLI